MNPVFSEAEAVAIRDILTRNPSPTDTDLAAIGSRPVPEMRQIIQRFSKMILDKSVKTSEIALAVNDARARSMRIPPRIDPVHIPMEPPIHSAGTLALPPKFRGKQIPKTPTATIQPPFAQFQSTSIPQAPVAYVQGTQLYSIPILPRYASSSSAISLHKKNYVAPKVGSLAAVLYPTLGPAHVCRVLGKCIQNDTECFLISFFQAENSPCYVPGEYLFQLQSDIGFPLGNEEEFRKCMDSGDICVDWLLERIFSSAQNLVINSAEILFPPEDVGKSAVKPTPQQVQQLMFQCVSCAALLILCYVAGEWAIPDAKLAVILSTILRTNAPRFMSTRNIMAEVEVLLTNLLLGKK